MHLHGKDLKIFTANSNPKVAEDIASALGLQISNSEVKTFKTLEDAKRFLKEEYQIKDGKLGFKGYHQDNLIGFPRIVKLSFITECVWEMT